MSKIEKNLAARALLLGVMSGMRSMSGPAAISRRAAQQPRGFKGTAFAPIASEEISTLVTLASVGEIVVDKLPFLPKRIDLLPLLGRLLLGGAAGAAAYAEAKGPLLTGASLGGVAAVGSSFLFYQLRRSVGRLLHLPDLPVALLEDGGVFWLGQTFLRSYE